MVAKDCAHSPTSVNGSTDSHTGQRIMAPLPRPGLLLLWLLLPLFLVACSQPEPPLKIGSNQWPGYESVYLARELGYFKGSEIKLVELPAASDAMQLIRDRSLDGAMLTLDEALTLVSEGIRLRVVVVMDISNGADSVIARPEIQSIDQLRGRRIGVERSAVGAVMLESMLEKANLAGDQIEPLNLSVDQHESAFRNGRVAAIVTFEPTRTLLLQKGNNELFSSRDIPGRIVDVLAVREERFEQRQESVETLVSAHFLALERIRQSPQKSYALIAPRLHIDEEDLAKAYQGLKLPDLAQNHEWLCGPEPMLAQSAARLARAMVRWDLIPDQPKLENLAACSALPEK